MKKSKLLRIVWGLALFLAACSQDGASQLEDQIWVLTSLNGEAPLEGQRPTLEIKAGQISGSTGCNHFGGSYLVESDSIQFKNIFSTEMACTEPDGIMMQEQIYLSLLRSANRFTVLDGVLTFFADSQPMLIFEIQQDSSLQKLE